MHQFVMVAAVGRRWSVGESFQAPRLASAWTSFTTVAEEPGGVPLAAAVDILWFYFGYSAYFTCVDENGWALARSESWLL